MKQIAIMICDIEDGVDLSQCIISGDNKIYYLHPREHRASVVGTLIEKFRPLPEKKETCSVIDYASGKAMIDEYENEFNLGWNACLKEITGETE